MASKNIAIYRDYQDFQRIRGASASERNFNNKKREFFQYFKDALNKEECEINGIPSMLAFQDHSQSNNKDLSDDKYIIADNDTDVNVGDYVTWRGDEWLVFTRENKTIATHNQLKIKAVNETIKWMVDGKVVNDGKGWGAYVRSLTLYTMGVVSTPHIEVVDGKMSMYMQNNEDTRMLRQNQRVFIGHRVYKIKFYDEIERKGLIFFLLDEDTIGEQDNVELRIADYNSFNEVEDSLVIVNEDKEKDVYIKGEQHPRISRTYSYVLNGVGAREWVFEHVSKVAPYYIKESSNNRLVLQFKDDFRFVGQKMTIIAISESNEYIKLPLSIIKKL